MDVNGISRFTEDNKEKRWFLIGQSLLINYKDKNLHYNILIQSILQQQEYLLELSEHEVVFQSQDHDTDKDSGDTV